MTRRLLAFLFLFALGGLSETGVGGCGGGAAALVDQIVFESQAALDGSDAANANGTANLWIMNADGTGRLPLTELTAAGSGSSGPAWSPDGTKIVFYSSRALDGSDAANLNETSNLWIMNADGGSVRPLTELTAPDSDSFVANSFHGSWSPDGKKILFTSFRVLDGSDAALPGFAQNIWVMNADGSDQRPLTELTTAGIFTGLQEWSPDGTKIAFSSTAALDGSDALNGAGTGVGNIWIMNADGSDRHPLTELTVGTFSTHFALSWSPDGSQIAFHSTRNLDGGDSLNPGFSENLWIMNADGTDPTPLTSYLTSGSINFPEFSPDGTKIAFNSTYDLSGADAPNGVSLYNLWVMNADGSDSRPLSRLTANGSIGSFRDWSPDSTRILFLSSGLLDGTDAVLSGVDNLWVADVASGILDPLTEITASGATSFSGDWF